MYLLALPAPVGGGDEAQLVERWTGTSPTQVRFSGAERDFFSQSPLSVQALLRCSHGVQ